MDMTLRYARQIKAAMSMVAMACVCLLLTACYRAATPSTDAWDLTDQQLDSISFSTTHHYAQGFNFVMKGDSLTLYDEPCAGLVGIDSMAVYRGDHLVVAEIQTVPADTIDSVWVKVARDQMTMGWTRECSLLKKVEPDDPISQFIDTFSDTHLLVFLALTGVVGALYGLRLLMRRKARIVHFHDIDSFYPTLLALLVASSATLYSSIQLFAPDSWRHFYYHPSLNPFSLPSHLALFVSSVWAIIIVSLAVVDDIRHQLPLAEAILYLCGLGAVCAVDYIVFSISTLYYIGYPLLVAYFIFALRCYFRHARGRYVCGHCGAQLTRKGRCPVCGAINE